MSLLLLQLGNALRCPASKFITNTVSHLVFLILLAAATFRLDEKSFIIASNSDNESQYVPYADLTGEAKVESMLKGNFRPANTLMTHVQICLMFWIFGELIAYSLDHSSSDRT